MAYPTIEENQAFCSIHGLCKIMDKGLERDEKVGKFGQSDISHPASATNTMNHDGLQAPDNVNERARLPDLKVEKDAKGDGGREDVKLGTDFKVPWECISCGAGFIEYRGRDDVMAAAYEKLFKESKTCEECSGGK